MRRFLEALQPVENPNDKATRENCRGIKGASGSTHLKNATFGSPDEHDMALYMKTAAANTENGKQNAAFNGRAFHSYAVSRLQETRTMHSTAYENPPLNLNALLLPKILQTATLLQPVKEMYLNAVRLWSYDRQTRK